MLATPAITIASISLGQCAVYSVQYLPGPDCGIFGTMATSAWGLTPAGTVCGYYMDCDSNDRAFVWRAGGGLTPIVFPFEITYARALAATDDTVVGECESASFPGRRAFRFDKQGVTLLDPLPGDNWTETYGVNSNGAAVGLSSSSNLDAVLWSGSDPIALRLSIGPYSTATDINEGGQTCGWMGLGPLPGYGATPFVWAAGRTSSLPLPAYAIDNTGAANALNNRGDACGYFFLTSNPTFIRRACAWIDGQFIDLGVLPGCNRSLALDINDAREIVGYCQPPTGGANIGFIWRNGVMTSLGSLAGVSDTALRFPRAINNRGQIAGEAHAPGTSAFLLTPALPAHAGDTNCDSLVNVNDLLAVITSWNPQGPVGGNPADLNRDNKIDINDLLQVVTHWSG